MIRLKFILVNDDTFIRIRVWPHWELHLTSLFFITTNLMLFNVFDGENKIATKTLFRVIKAIGILSSPFNNKLKKKTVVMKNKLDRRFQCGRALL